MSDKNDDTRVYKISEFSRITRLTAKALRYYEQEGILQPSARDWNNYRLYNEGDYEKAKMIALLREYDFSIMEIKDVLEICQDSEDLACIMKEKITFIEENIKKEKTLIRNLSKKLSEKEKGEKADMKYEIEVKQITKVKVASIRYQGGYQDVGKHIGTLYKEVKNEAAGAPFQCYYDAEYKENADIELCVPIKKTIDVRQTTVKELPAIQALCTVHTGSYDKIGEAYKALMDYARKHDISCGLPSREIYIKGPGAIFKGNPDKYITEILIPVLNQ